MKFTQLILKTLAEVFPTGLPQANPESVLPNFLRIVFMIIAIVAVIFVAVGGLKYTLSNGDPQGITSAKNTIVSAIVGLVIAISAFTLVSFVAGRL